MPNELIAATFACSVSYYSKIKYIDKYTIIELLQIFVSPLNGQLIKYYKLVKTKRT